MYRAETWAGHCPLEENRENPTNLFVGVCQRDINASINILKEGKRLLKVA